MDAETFEQFRTFQRNKEDLEDELSKTERYLQVKLSDICSLLLSGVIQNCDSVNSEPTFEISSPADLKKAMELAFDWFA